MKHKNNKKLVLFAHPHFTPAPGPEALDFSRRLSRGRMVADEKEQGFQGFGHLDKPFRYPSVCLCVGETSIL